MADTSASEFLEHRSEPDNRAQVLDRQPTRLTGDLAAGTTVGTSSTAKEKVRVKGAQRIRVRGKLTGTALDADVNIKPLLADDATQATTGTDSEGSPVDDTEFMIDLELKGEKLLEIEVVNANGSNTLDISYIDVYLF